MGHCGPAFARLGANWSDGDGWRPTMDEGDDVHDANGLNRNGSQRRRRVGALAAAAVLAAALGGCASTFTAQPYTPGVGVNADLGQNLQVRALVLVVNGTKTYLTGSVVSYQKDTLDKVTGQALDSSGSATGSPLDFTGPTSGTVRANNVYAITDQNVSTPTGDLEAGLTAKVTLQFSKAGSTTVTVPVVDVSNPDYATLKPALGK